MKEIKHLLAGALFMATIAAGSNTAFASMSDSNPLGVDFTAVADNTNNKSGFNSDINIIGWAFTVNQAFDIKGLGYFDYNGNTMTGSHDVALYRSNGEKVVSATVDPADTLQGAAQWRFQSIPITTLTAGDYILAAIVGDDLYTYNPNNVTWHPNITYTGDVYDSSNTSLPITWTSEESACLDAGGFGPNFVATPIPAAVYLMGSGLIGLIGIRRRNR